MNQSRLSLLRFVVLYLGTSTAICAALQFQATENGNDEQGAVIADVVAEDLATETSSYDEDTFQQYTKGEACRTAYRLCKKGRSHDYDGHKKNSLCYPGLPTRSLLVRPNPIGVVKGVTGNYKLSFTITPKGILKTFGSILHFTNGNNYGEFGSRSPGIWFNPDTTVLVFVLGDSLDSNWSPTLATVAVPLNVPTAVVLECVGPDVKITVGSTVLNYLQPSFRYSASNLFVYAGDPWHPAANAVIKDLCYQILPKTPSVRESQDEDDYLK